MNFRHCCAIIQLIFVSSCATLSFAQNTDVEESQNNTEIATNVNNKNNTLPVPQNVVGVEDRHDYTSAVYVGLVSSMGVLSIVLVGMLAVCMYKNKTFAATAQRVMYRSSDSSILIRNEYRDGEQKQNMNGEIGINRTSRLAEKTDYPAYGVTGPNPLNYEAASTNTIDSTLTKNAELFHYQQQKSKIKARLSTSSDSSSRKSGAESNNDVVDDEENSDGEYTVYECPGLASRTDGPLEIHNPLFTETSSSYSNPAITGINDKSFPRNDFSHFRPMGHEVPAHQ